MNRQLSSISGWIFAILLLLCSMASPASAAVNNVSVLPNNSAPGATGTTLTWTWSGYQTATAVKCIEARFSGGYQASTNHYDWNAGVQGWSDAWVQGATVSHDTVNFHSGGGSMKLTQDWDAFDNNAAGDNNGTLHDLTGDGDELSAWVFVPGGTAGSWQASISLQDASYTYQYGPLIDLVVGQWTKVTWVPPISLMQNARASSVRVASTGNNSVVGVSIDDFQQGYSVTDYNGDMPEGMSLSSATMGGTFETGTWTRDGTSASTGTLVFNNASGATPTGGTSNITIGSITQPSPPAGQTVYATVTTYSAVGSGSSGSCGGSVLDGPSAAAYTTHPLVSVSATIDPAFTFAVGNQASACNGESNFVSGAGTANSVALGHVAGGANVSGGQALTITSNAANGFTVYLRGAYASSNLRSAGHSWADVAGTYASPAVLGAGERFGYTYNDSTASSSVTDPASANFIAVSNTDRVVMGSLTSMDGSGCVSYDAQSAATTPAGTYTATIIYTAVPRF